MNRILKLASVARQARLQAVRRGLCHHEHGHGDYKNVGFYHSYKEFARTLSMNEIPAPTMKYSEGAAHFNAKYNRVLAIGAAVFAVTSAVMLSSGFFHVPGHRPLKNTEAGLEFLNHPHEGYHPKEEE